MDRSRRIFDDWVATWAHIRDLSPSEVDGWPLVPVGSASRRTELLCLDPGIDELTAVSRHIAGDPRAMLTVAADDVTPYRGLVPAGTRIDRDDETLMSADFSPLQIPRISEELTCRWDVDQNRLTYTLESGQQVAAHGSVGVIGEVATLDAVETTPSFQRQGLGRHVVMALTDRAMAEGARRGVLAATAQGRQLYLGLGWSTELELLSFMGA